MAEGSGAGELLAAKSGAIFPHLDEQQRRLLMGAEARTDTARHAGHIDIMRELIDGMIGFHQLGREHELTNLAANESGGYPGTCPVATQKNRPT